jgi:hypothetical protein
MRRIERDSTDFQSAESAEIRPIRVGLFLFWSSPVEDQRNSWISFRGSGQGHILFCISKTRGVLRERPEVAATVQRKEKTNTRMRRIERDSTDFQSAESAENPSNPRWVFSFGIVGSSASQRKEAAGLFLNH